MDLPPNPTDSDVAEANRKQIFVRDAMPGEWLSYSEELGDAAEALWMNSSTSLRMDISKVNSDSVRIEKVCGHSRSYILLAGLALENVLKGLLVAEEPSLISTGILDSSLRTHKLLDLAGFVLDDADRRVLQICQDAIPYWGRYPVPLRYSSVQAQEATTLDFRDSFRELHRRLCKTVHDAIKDGWDSGVGPIHIGSRNQRYGDVIDLKQPIPQIDQNDA